MSAVTSQGRSSGGRSSPLTRRVGYALAVVVNFVLLVLTVVWPGWDVVPFLTPATAEVIPIVVASLFVGMAVNVLNLITDSRALWSIGEIVGSAVTIAVALRFWQVFPFDFGTSMFDWTPIVRLVIALTVLGCAIAILVHIVTLVRMAFDPARRSWAASPARADIGTPG
jgi:hypothetical protein